MTNLINNPDAGKLVLRLTLGVLMLFHGVAKILHSGSLDFIGARLVSAGLPEATVYAVYVGEILAPILLIAGIFCRLGGLLVVINMVVAIGIAHMGDLWALTEHGGYRLELQAFYLFSGLALVFLGSGRYAIKPD